MRVVAKSVTNGSALTRDITRQIPSRVTPRLNSVGTKTTKYIHAWLNGNFQRRDNPTRRNKDMDAGYSRLHDSFSYEVVNNMTGRGQGKINMAVEINSSANPRLLAIIEGGSGAHPIRGRTRPDSSVLFPRGRDAALQAMGVEGKRLIKIPVVNHRGTKRHSQGGNSPWKIALQRAVKESMR